MILEVNVPKHQQWLQIGGGGVTEGVQLSLFLTILYKHAS